MRKYTFIFIVLLLVLILSFLLSYTHWLRNAPEGVNSNSEVRAMAIRALDISKPDEITYEKLKNALNDKETIVRLAATLVLENMGSEAKPLLPVLLDSLNDANPFVRDSLIRIIGNISHSDEVEFAFITMLNDESDYVRTSAAFELGEFGSISIVGIDKLNDVAVHDSSNMVRAAAKSSLNKLNKK